jgi:type IV fimbrial biogenesis protein FimT
MLKRLQAQRGITLIEIMIGLVILSLLLAVGVPSFASFMQNTQIRNAAEALQNGLSLARAEAVRRNTNIRFSLGAASSWTVGCMTAVADADGDGGADCPATIQARAASEGSANAAVAVSEIVVSTNAAAASPVVTSDIVFTGMGKVRALPGADYVAFDITNPGAGSCAANGGTMRCLRIVVTAGGQVRMCDPKLSQTKPTDPQAC